MNDSDVRAWWRKRVFQGYLGFCVLCLVLLLGLGLWRSAQAAPLAHPTSLVELYKAAIKFGGYEDKCNARINGCPMPAVVLVYIEDSNIAGQFDPSHPTFVKLSALMTPGTVSFNAVMVHEFVHYLQWLFGDLGPDSGCKDTPRIEEQAYAAAAEYLKQFGIIYDYSDQMVGIHLMAVLCEAAGGM